MLKGATTYFKTMLTFWIGVAFGCAILLILFAALSSSSTNSGEWLPAVFGIVGTVVGALISAFVSFRLHVTQQFDRDLSSALSVALKVGQIYSNFVTAKSYIEESIDTAAEGGLGDAPIWLKVKAPVAPPQRILIPPEEMQFLIKAREYKLQQNISLVVLKHNGMVDAFEMFGRHRTSIEELFPEDPLFDGLTMERIPPQDRAAFVSQRTRVNSLVRILLKILREDTPFVRKTHNEISPAARKLFGAENFPNIKAE